MHRYMIVMLLVLLSLTGCNLSEKVNKKVRELERKQVQNKDDDGMVIYNRKLTFSDFRGKPSYSTANKHVLGLTATKVTYHFSNPLKSGGKVYYKFTTQCLFVPTHSWIKEPGDTLTLLHEQVHFDIYRIAAIELKQQLNAAGFSEVNSQVEMQEIYRRIMDKYKIINSQFDISEQRDYDNSIRWRKKVDAGFAEGKLELGE